MSALSDTAFASPSNLLQGSLQTVASALAGTSLEALAGAIGKEDTQASRIRSNQLGATVQEVVRLLHAAGIKCVRADRICVKRDKYEALVTIAAAAMADKQTVQRLTWDET